MLVRAVPTWCYSVTFGVFVGCILCLVNNFFIFEHILGIINAIQDIHLDAFSNDLSLMVIL
jgi:hypothetical protein